MDDLLSIKWSITTTKYDQEQNQSHKGEKQANPFCETVNIYVWDCDLINNDSLASATNLNHETD